MALFLAIAATQSPWAMGKAGLLGLHDTQPVGLARVAKMMGVTPMYSERIGKYRAEAAACLRQAELDQNKITAGRWLKLADEWSRMADEIEFRIK